MHESTDMFIGAVASSRSNYPLIGLSILNTSNIIECIEFTDSLNLGTLFSKTKNLDRIIILQGQNEFFNEKLNFIELERQHFNVKKAIEFIQENFKTLIYNKKSNYFALSSLSALLNYLEINFTKEIKEIKEIKFSNEKMLLSENVIRNLNIFGKESLFSKIKHTKTKFGTELLKQNLIEPLINEKCILERQRFVIYLKENLEFAEKINYFLTKFVVLEKIKTKINNLGNLNEELFFVLILELHNFSLISQEFIKLSFPEEKEFLFLKNLIKKLEKFDYKEIINSIFESQELINTELPLESYFNNFLIKNELLDLLKKMFNENIEDLRLKVQEIFSEKVEIYFDSKRGYILKSKEKKIIDKLSKIKESIIYFGSEIPNLEKEENLKKEEISDKLSKKNKSFINGKQKKIINRKMSLSNLEGEISILNCEENISNDLSKRKAKNILESEDSMSYKIKSEDLFCKEELIYLFQKENYFYFTTITIQQKNFRTKLIFNKILQLIAQETLEKISKLNNLEMFEEIGLLDILNSFYLFSLKHETCIPTLENSLIFTDSTNILIKNKEIKKNCVYSSDLLNFNIITGPNNAGKTSYLRMIGHNVILAQIGCPLPCKFAITKIFKNIFIRIGNQITQENSSFELELIESKLILERSSRDSLILIDELGKCTNFYDSTSFVLTFILFLLKKNAFVFFITHNYSIFNILKDDRINVFKLQSYVTKKGVSTINNAFELAEKYLPFKVVETAKMYCKEEIGAKFDVNELKYIFMEIKACTNEEERRRLKDKILGKIL